MFQFINLPVFIVSFAIGVLFVYLYNDDERTIYVYPTPENVDLLQYKDATGHCFYFTQTEVACPKDASKIAKLPAQS